MGRSVSNAIGEAGVGVPDDDDHVRRPHADEYLASSGDQDGQVTTHAEGLCTSAVPAPAREPVMPVPPGRIAGVSPGVSRGQEPIEIAGLRGSPQTEIVRESGVMMLLGVMRAEERIAAFLLNMSQRLGARGYSAMEFHLRMTREEIGSYLGLKLETVSRAFSRFHADGLITVDQKFVRIVDLQGLKNIYAHHVS